MRSFEEVSIRSNVKTLSARILTATDESYYTCLSYPRASAFKFFRQSREGHETNARTYRTADGRFSKQDSNADARGQAQM